MNAGAFREPDSSAARIQLRPRSLGPDICSRHFTFHAFDPHPLEDMGGFGVGLTVMLVTFHQSSSSTMPQTVGQFLRLMKRGSDTTYVATYAVSSYPYFSSGTIFLRAKSGPRRDALDR